MHSRLAELELNIRANGADVCASGLDDRARGALLILIEAAAALKEFSNAKGFGSHLCPNCGSPTQSIRTPYCSNECRCEAAFVRQTRAGLAEGTILDPDRQVALGESFWHLLGGVYPRRQGMVIDRVLRRVMKRVEGKCEICGEPATTVDHIGSG